MEALSKISNIISQLKRKKEEEKENVDISDLEIIFMKILNVLKTGLEEEKARFATERMFQEEKDYEDEKKHEEFLSVLKQFVSMQPMEKIQEEEKSSGILNFFKNLIETLKNFFKGFLLPKLIKVFGILKNVFMKTIEIVGKLIKKIGSLMLRVLNFIKKLNWGKLFLRLGRIFFTLVRFGGPIALAVVALAGTVAAVSYLSGKMTEFIKENVPNFSALKIDEAKALLEQKDDKLIENYLQRFPNALPDAIKKRTDLTPRQKLEAFLTQRYTELTQKQEKDGLSEQEKKELAELEKPAVTALPTTGKVDNVIPEREKVNPRPEFVGYGKEWNKWNQNYFRYYRPEDGVKREKPTDEPLPTTEGELRRRREELQSQKQQTATPVRTGTPLTELDQKKQQIEQASQVLTERLKELNVNKQKLSESKSSAKGGRERYKIDQDIKNVDEEIIKTQKQLRDLQRGIIPQGISRATVLPQTMTPEDVVSPQPSALDTAGEAPKPATATQMPMSEESPASSMTPETMSMDVPRQETAESKISAPVQEPNRVSNLFNTLNQENRMLELTRTMAMNQTTSTGPIVNNVGKTEVIPDVPLSVEASQRDDTHTLSVVLSRYKRAYV